MKPLNGRTLVKQEKRINNTVKVGGREFILDSVFRQYWNTVQMAEVLAADRGDILPGDIVYVHHFVTAPEQQLPIIGGMSFLEYNQIYATMDNGELRVLDKFVLVEPVTYGTAGIITQQKGLLLSSHSDKDQIEKIGILRHANRKAIEAGLKDGDKIIFNKNCEYEILIGEQVYYRMELRDVITTIDSFEQLKI
jgi:co-chaperonin GroES (HSP10)